MRGRTDKYGTLIGFTDPFKKNLPREYTVDALSRCSLLTITRAELKSMMTLFEEDKPHILKAIDTANEQHRVAGTKKAHRQSLRVSKDQQNANKAALGDSPEPTRATNNGSITPTSVPEGYTKEDGGQAASPVKAENVATAPVAANVASTGGSSGGLFGMLTPSSARTEEMVEKLQGEVKWLREQIVSQNDQMAKQTKMMEQILGDRFNPLSV